MPRLPVLPAREIIRILRRAGFEIVSQRGSRMNLRGARAGTTWTVIVPNYAEVPRAVLASILRQAGLSRDEFLELR